jgi:hypothetical protein
MRELGLNKRATDLRKRRGARKRARGSGNASIARERDSAGPGEGSGLARAIRLRAKPSQVGDEAPSQAGISADDRKEIQDEIEKVARRNRMSARPEDFLVRPKRKGFVFPLVVNLLAIAATAGAVLLLSYVFRQRDIAIAGTSYALDTAEGKLLQELKRDSDSKLEEKDKAINEIRDRLSSLDKEKNDLAANIDQKVKARETELRSKFQDELDAEKKRLADQGVSSSVLQARIKSFETERTAALDKQLDDARKTADTEKTAAEDRIDQLRGEYQKSILDLGEERRRIQDEAKGREDALRASLNEKTKELETQSAAAAVGLEKARAQLDSLEEQRSRTQSEDDRILGFYGTIRSALRDRRYADAADSSASLASYLADPSLAKDPATQSRREADLFVAETLGTYARSELESTSADADRLLTQAGLLASAREAAAAAETALKKGDTALASSKYLEALGKVPEILAAHQYFIDQIQTAEALRRSRLEEALSAAEKAFGSGDQVASSAHYSEALAYLPLNDSARNALMTRLGQLAVAEDSKSRRSADTAAARPMLAAASARLAAEDWPAAVSGYISLIASYPEADQTADALKGIDRARLGMEKSAESRAESSAAEIQTARKDLADAQAAAKAEASNLRSNVEDLKKQLADAQTKTAQAARVANPAIGTAAQAAQTGKTEELQAEVERLKDESAKDAAELEKDRAGAAKYDALLSSYRSYLASEAKTRGNGGQDASLSGQSGLYDFLGGREVSDAFPGLRDKVASFQETARTELLDAFPSDASEIVQQALAFKDKAALGAYYASKRDVYAKSGNKLMVNFLDAVSKVVD